MSPLSRSMCVCWAIDPATTGQRLVQSPLRTTAIAQIAAVVALRRRKTTEMTGCGRKGMRETYRIQKDTSLPLYHRGKGLLWKETVQFLFIILKSVGAPNVAATYVDF